MHKQILFTVLILVVVVFTLQVMWATVRLAEAGADCTGYTGFKCDSCTAMVLCSDDSIVRTFTCQPNQVSYSSDYVLA